MRKCVRCGNEHAIDIESISIFCTAVKEVHYGRYRYGSFISRIVYKDDPPTDAPKGEPLPESPKPPFTAVTTQNLMPTTTTTMRGLGVKLNSSEDAQ